MREVLAAVPSIFFGKFSHCATGADLVASSETHGRSRSARFSFALSVGVALRMMRPLCTHSIIPAVLEAKQSRRFSAGARCTRDRSRIVVSCEKLQRIAGTQPVATEVYSADTAVPEEQERGLRTSGSSFVLGTSLRSGRCGAVI